MKNIKNSLNRSTSAHSSFTKSRYALSVLILGTLFLTACGNQTSQNVDAQNNAAEEITETIIENEETDTETSENATGIAVTGEVNTITVNSTEQVSVIPDIAQVIYSVRTQSKTAAECQQKNGEAVDQVIETLKGLGIEETSIQTSDYYMNPVYDYSNNTARITAYESSASLTVSDLPIEGLSDLLAQSVSSGINTIQSITYQASGYDRSYQEALTKASASAYEKAKALAEASGCTVGGVIRIEETSSYSEARYNDSALANKLNLYSAKQEMAMEDAAGRVMPGKIQVEAGIIVEYQLQ